MYAQHPQEYHDMKLLKIAIVGPESTGKSTIAQQLAQHFNTVCVPEYAREYCKNLGNTYTLQDELNMFYGQKALENTLLPLARPPFIFCDTTILTVKIWCDHLFGDTPQEVKDAIQENAYDFYLLMDINLPWEDDPLRDFPEQRAHFMKIWKTELQSLNAPFQVISGLGENRFQAALTALATAFGNF